MDETIPLSDPSHLDRDDLPDEVTEDDIWQLLTTIEERTRWVKEHSDIKHQGIIQECANITGAASRAAYMRKETIERKKREEESQVTLPGASDGDE